jgi:hypothetical protein
MCEQLACGLSAFRENEKSQNPRIRPLLPLSTVESVDNSAESERMMTESNLSWLNRNDKTIHKVIHNAPGPSVLLAGIVKNAIGRGVSDAFCTGCHGGETFHVMAYVDNSLVHVYTSGGDAARPTFDAIVREVKTLGLRYEEWVETALGRRWHLRFEMVG